MVRQGAPWMVRQGALSRVFTMWGGGPGTASPTPGWGWRRRKNAGQTSYCSRSPHFSRAPAPEGQSRRAGQAPATRRLASWAWRLTVRRGGRPWLAPAASVPRAAPLRRPRPPRRHGGCRRPGSAGPRRLRGCAAARSLGRRGGGERGLARPGLRPRPPGVAAEAHFDRRDRRGPLHRATPRDRRGRVPDNRCYREHSPRHPDRRPVPDRRSQVVTGGPHRPGPGRAPRGITTQQVHHHPGGTQKGRTSGVLAQQVRHSAGPPVDQKMGRPTRRGARSGLLGSPGSPIRQRRGIARPAHRPTGAGPRGLWTSSGARGALARE
jgi:hypothetical protein